MKYIDELCSKCGEVFKEDDDIVVCPDCGSPHHRKCYESENKCANSSRHSEGFKWQKTIIPKNEKKYVRISVVCPRCGAYNSDTAVSCEKCGAELKPFAPQGDAADRNDPNMEALKQFLNIDPNSRMRGIPIREIIAFVKSNILYYIPMFRRMDATGKNISFNLICFLFPPLYFANRKMWFWAILTAFISVLLTMPLAVSYMSQMGSEAAFFSESVITALMDNHDILIRIIQLCNMIDLVFRIFFCLFGNRLYYGFVIGSLNKMRAANGGDLKPEHLRGAGGIRPINSVLIIAITFALTFCAMMASQIFLETIF